jgi:hypothetical protein
MDRREEILKECDKLSDGLIWDGNGDIIKYDGDIKTILNAMDENGKQMCLDILEYMAKNRIVCGIYSSPDGELFKHNGRYLTREQLFENFL